ncbi:MAG: hypothetical protein EBX40_04305 [Gammaproteobacteria bacterium]|nr:hypothetical protein [Gammaproteobacteria bacterium]
MRKIITKIVLMAFLFAQSSLVMADPQTTSALTATGSSSGTVNCDAIPSQIPGANGFAAAAVCHQIVSDAYSQGVSVSAYAAQVGTQMKTNNQYIAQLYSPKVSQALANAPASPMSSRANPMLSEAVGATSQTGCQALCASADAVMGIPIIGWIIAAALIGTAIGEGCDNCGGFDPV